MKIIKKGTYLANGGKTYNVYIVKSPDSWRFMVAFDADPFYGGCAFDFDRYPIQEKLELAIQSANKLNPIWEF